MSRDVAVGLFLAEAAIAGAIIGWPGIDPAVEWGTVIIGGFGAAVWRKRVLHENSWSRHEIQWLVIFATVWVGIEAWFWNRR